MRYLFCGLFSLIFLGTVASLGSAAPPGCKGPQFRSLDFALGTWIAHNNKGELNGKSEITKVLAGCSVRMHWTGRTYEGTNNNTFDETRLSTDGGRMWKWAFTTTYSRVDRKTYERQAIKRGQ